MCSFWCCALARLYVNVVRLRLRDVSGDKLGKHRDLHSAGFYYLHITTSFCSHFYSEMQEVLFFSLCIIPVCHL